MYDTLSFMKCSSKKKSSTLKENRAIPFDKTKITDKTTRNINSPLTLLRWF